MWEGPAFAPVPIFLGGSQSCHSSKEAFTFTFVLGGSLWYFRDIGPHAGTLFWRYELSYLPCSCISILCHIPLKTLEPVGFPKACVMGIPQSPLEHGGLVFVGWIRYLEDCSQKGVCRWSSWLGHHFRLVRQMSFCPQISSSFSTGQPLPPWQMPEPVTQASLIPPLKKTPKWMRRPAGVSFAVSVVCVCAKLCV